VPPGAVYVGRPTRFGNPFAGPLAVDAFRDLLVRRRRDAELAARWPYPSDVEIRRDLAGRDLMCWCPLPVRTVAEVAERLGTAITGPVDLCHADVLLRVANGGEP
jgi:hypothetical protein